MNKCRKFVPNIFNKNKCQDCFAPKELHSAEALECNKMEDEADLTSLDMITYEDQEQDLSILSMGVISRKVSKCGYLFVAPDFDFNNPMDRTRRWQRRFFVLYDDGELTFSVDENPDTVPQGCVDMNKCLDVYDAESVTSHQHSISVSSQDKTYYIKGTTKDEISRWFDILVMYPRSNIKTKWIRAPSIHNLAEKENQQDGIQSKNNQQNLSELRKPLETSTVENKSSTYNNSRFTVTSHGPGSIDKGKSRLEGTPFTTHRGVRSLKHKNDKAYQEGLRKSNSMYDLTEDKNSEPELVTTRFRSRSRDRLDDLGYLSETNPYATLPRTLRTSRLELSASTEALGDNGSSCRGNKSETEPELKFYTNSTSVKPITSGTRDRSRSSSVGRDQPDASSSPRQSGVGQQKGELTHEELLGSRGNETDELKLAKGDEDVDSSPSPSDENLADENEKVDSVDEAEMAKSSEGGRPSESSQGAEASIGELSYTKKGWLIKQGPSDMEGKKHWFVLSGESLRYYKDSRAEDHHLVDGRIDLSTCYDVSEASNTRNYGFRIKNQNGDYLLSAMTSGIRNNWVKAVGKCAEYNQQRKRSSLSGESSSSTERSPREDLARSSSESSFKRLSTSREAQARKLDTGKPVRRHYSDLNLRSIGDMVLVKDINIGNEVDASASCSSTCTGSIKGRSRDIHRIGHRSLTNNDTKDIKIRFLDKLDSESSSKSSSAVDRKTRKSSLTDLELYRKYSSSHDELTSSKPPFRRYVEGSDSVAVSSHVTDSMGTSKSSSRLEDVRNADRVESLRQRAKSPSARIKDKTRAKSPRLHSPPPGSLESGSAESEEDNQYSPRSAYKGRNSGPEDSSTVTSTRNSVVVDLLEAEVDSLKNQLEKSQQELQDVHMNNSDLKSQVQTLRRDHRDPFTHLLSDTDHAGQDEPDSSLDYSMELPAPSQSLQRKQNRDAQDTIRRQKTEIDTLKSKLDMSLSKLTKTEDELAKAVNNLKQEKEKFLRLSDDWNARIKTLEDQLRDTASTLDTKKEELSSKDNENRRLSNDIKGTLEKLRNSEREILKLKAVERDYKTTKEQLDNMERDLGTTKAKLREQDGKLKKVEEEYEKQLDEIEHQFSGDRDELEQQLENFQKRLLQAHRQSTIADNVNSDMKDILKEKDEIISQLEEKVIETDGKVEEMSKQLDKSGQKATKAEQATTLLDEQNKELQAKLKKAEKEMGQLRKLKRESESERASLHRRAESSKKGKSQQTSEIESLKAINGNLNEQNDALQASIMVLNNRVSDLEQRCDDKQREVDKLLQSVPLSRPGSGDVLQKYDRAMDEMQQVKSKLIHLEHVLQDYQVQQGSSGYHGALHGLHETTSILRELQKKLEVTNEALKETTLLVDDPLDRPEFSHKITVNNSSSSPAILAEYFDLKKKFDKAIFEIKKLKREVRETEQNYITLEAKEKTLREQKVVLEKDYFSQLERMHERVNDLTTKLCAKTRPPPMRRSTSSGLSRELDSQLQTLEHNIEFVESAIRSQDTDAANLQQQIGLVERQVVLTQEMTPARPTPSTSDDDILGSACSADSSSPDLSDGDTSAPFTSNRQLTSKLKQMKLQLESTNIKMKDIASKMGDQGTSQVELRSLKQKEHKLQEQIRKYEERLRQLNLELVSHASVESSVMGSHLHSVEEKLSQTETTLENCRAKLSSIISVIESYQSKAKMDLGTDRLSVLKEQIVDVMQCASTPASVPDQETLRKINESRGFLLTNLRNKESNLGLTGPLTENQKLCLYAEKLACEAVILGELSYILQKQDSGVLDIMILKDIQDTNYRMFKLEQQLGNKPASKEGVQDLDVLGSYASLIADKITMEGKLSALTGSKTDEVRNTSVMLSENDPEQNSVLAEEVLVRSQIQESMGSSQESKTQPMESVESYAGLLATRALIQGEITFALAQMKGKIGKRMTDMERSDLVKQELSGALEHLNDRYSVLTEAIGAYRQEKISSLARMLAVETVNTVAAAGIEDEQQSVQASMCDFVGEVVNGVRDQYVKDWNRADSRGESGQQEKIRQMQLCLKEEFDLAFSELKSKYTNILPTTTPNLSQTSSLKDEIKSNAATFSAVLAQYAVIVGSTKYLNALRDRKGHEMEGQPDMVATSEPVQRMKKILGEVIMKEACIKETRASELRGKVRATSGQIADLAGHIPELSGWRGEALAAYADILVREAVFQAELTYMTLKLKMHHREELQQLHEYYEAKYGRMEDSEGVAESYAECESLLAKPEGTLEDEHSKVAEALKSVEVGIKKLKMAVKSSSSKDLPKQADSLEKLLKQAVSMVRKTQEDTTSSILKDMKDAKTKIEEIMDDHEHEKESLVAEYEDRIAQLEEEIDAIKEDHESEFDQLKQDMFTAVSAIRATEVQSEADMSNEIMRLRHQLSSQRAKVMMELKSMRSSIPHSQRNTKLASALLGKIQNVEHILAGFKSGSQESLLEMTNQEFSSSSTDEESEDESSEMSDGGEELEVPKGGHAKKIDTRVHKRVLLRMHERHKTQLGQLRKEKDKALEDEMKSTKAALEAMSKKYEQELQSERDKYGEALSKLYTEEDVAERNKKHSLEVEHLKEEVTKLNKKFKKKGEDLRSLEEKLTKSMADNRDERRRLASRNDQINSNMSRELDKLKTMISKGAESSRSPSKSDKEDLYNAQVLSRVKETEMKQTKEQLKGLTERMQKAEEGREQAISQYRELYGKYEAFSTEHDEEVERLKRKVEQALGFRGDNKKGLRRVSSFNQRDRSPSPQRPGEAKKKEGHTSRADGPARRRYLPPRDLKRSKSSPTLPVVAKLPVIQSKLEENAKTIQRTTELTKSSSSKMSKT